MHGGKLARYLQPGEVADDRGEILGEHVRWALLAIAAVSSACFNPSYDRPMCGSHGECPDGLRCGLQNVCESVPTGGVSGTKAFGTAVDFADGKFQDMTIEAHGSLTPNAYTYGGLSAHGLQGTSLWARGDTSWTKLDMVTPSGAGLWHGEQLQLASDLTYLGVTAPGVMTLWFEGEVWLDAGSTETFTINGDDLAFVALANPGTTDYVLLTDQNITVPVATPVSGWYPIRIGWSNADTVGSNFDFRHSDLGSEPDRWTRDRLRARTSELSGMLRTVYGRQILGGGLSASPPVAHFDQSDLLTATMFSPLPQGAGSADWSARYLGQVYIRQAGAYTLTITSDDGNRGRLGTGRGETGWARDHGVGSQAAVTVVSAMLATGWNDVAVDYNQVTGGSSLHVQLQGPDYPGATEVPRDVLRPVESADDRLALGVDDGIHLVPDNGGPNNPGTATMTVVGFARDNPSTETVGSIELTFQISSIAPDQLKIDLQTPGTPGTRVTILDQVTLPAGDRVAQLTIPSNTTGALAGLLGGAASGDWKLHVYDVVAGSGNSKLESARLTLHTTGGPDKIARAASWFSPVIDATMNVVAIDGIATLGRVPPGSGIQIRIRTCQAADCGGVEWSAPVTVPPPFAVPAARYLQLRVDMTSNGTSEPELQSLQVTYRRDPG